MISNNFRNITYFEKIKNICVSYLYNNYDFCYLSAMHEKNKNIGADTTIIGSSHAMNGIIENELGNAGDVISFCISSQDLYYDFEHIKRAVEKGARPIKRCLMNLGYYMMYQDLSMSKQIRIIIPETYMNLFGDYCVHNYRDAIRIDLMKNVDIDTELYPYETVSDLCRFWGINALKEQSTFYGPLMKRENNNMLGVKHVIWKELSDEQKTDYVINRVVNGHNKHINHLDTRKENGIILEEMVKYLHEHKIKTYFFITPFTKKYNEYIEPKYLPDIFKALDSLKYPVEFLDMNDYGDYFDDSDFIDSDHLNELGAHKATAILNNYIKLVEG